MSRVLKSLMHGAIVDRLDGVDGGLFISTAGLNSELTFDLRRSLNSRNLRYMVLRNSLARMAFEHYGYPREEIDKILTGPVGMVYTTDEGSATTAAKAIDAWKTEKKDKIVQLKGAFLDGEVLDANDAKTLKDAPTKEQARAMLLGVIQAPATQLLGTIREPFARIVYVLNNYHDKRNEG